MKAIKQRMEKDIDVVGKIACLAKAKVEELDRDCTREGYLNRLKEEEVEECNINRFMEVSKVAGNFHFAAGKSLHYSQHFLSNLLNIQLGTYNISHKINKLSFGKEFPGVVNPLDGAQWTHHTFSGLYQYFLKVVPTIYTDIRGHIIHSNQYSVTEHFRDENVYPKPPRGVYFIDDFSLIKIQAVMKKYDILFVADEVITAFGRLGTMFGCDKYNIQPDLVSIAKALSSAYMPIGAVLVSPEILEVIDSQSHKLGLFAHGFTYSGHPVAYAVAL